MSSIFHAYLQQTRHVVLYRLPSTIQPRTSFPFATTVAVIDCAPLAIATMLRRAHFPRLESIHYLSAHPGRVDLYREWKCDWVFPNQDYAFYQCMVEGGWGRVDHRIIGTYIDRVHGSGMDLRLPGLGVYPGTSRYVQEAGAHVTGYQWHLMEYLHTPYRPVQGVLADELNEEGWSEPMLEREFMGAILKNKGTSESGSESRSSLQ